jgi:dihydrofolate reductase
LTLDGVMQAPGRPEEDTRDGFAHGGWSAPNVDDQLVAATYALAAEGGGLQLLLGRRSYEDMLGYWNTQDSPFKDGLNNAPKYVASRTLREPLPWPNSTLLRGEVADAVAQLKRDLTGDLHVMGSGDLIQTLMHSGLIDGYLLFTTPSSSAAAGGCSATRVRRLPSVSSTAPPRRTACSSPATEPEPPARMASRRVDQDRPLPNRPRTDGRTGKGPTGAPQHVGPFSPPRTKRRKSRKRNGQRGVPRWPFGEGRLL